MLLLRGLSHSNLVGLSESEFLTSTLEYRYRRLYDWIVAAPAIVLILVGRNDLHVHILQ